jgi:hypothetical protein
VIREEEQEVCDVWMQRAKKIHGAEGTDHYIRVPRTPSQREPELPDGLYLTKAYITVSDYVAKA